MKNLELKLTNGAYTTFFMRLPRQEWEDNLELFTRNLTDIKFDSLNFSQDYWLTNQFIFW